MPMIPEAVFAMLACARLGVTHSVVFGGFAAQELAGRIKDSEAKLVFSASCGIEPHRLVNYKEILDQAIKLSEAENVKTIIFQRKQKIVDLI
jgi:propionyl-CoA synthetase